MRVLRRLPSTKQITSIYFDRALLENLKGFKEAVTNKNTSAVFVIDGLSGLGKSVLAQQVAIFLDKKFDLSKMFWEPQKFLEGLANAKPGDAVIFDEAMLLSSRSALSEINRMTIQAMSMIRSKRIYVIFCCNSIFDLDKNLSIFRANLLLHLYGDNFVDRGKYAAFFRARGQEDKLKTLYLLGRKYYDYRKPHANFIGRFNGIWVCDEQEYEKRKQEGINNFLNGNIKTPGKMYMRIFEGRNALIRHLHKQFGYTYQRIAEICGVERTVIADACANVPQKQAISVSEPSFIPHEIQKTNNGARGNKLNVQEGPQIIPVAQDK